MAKRKGILETKQYAGAETAHSGEQLADSFTNAGKAIGEGLFYSALENIPFPVGIVDTLGMLVWTNRDWQKSSGVAFVQASPGEKYLDSVREAITADHEFAQVRDAVNAVTAGKKASAEFTYPVINVDHQKWFSFTVKRLEELPVVLIIIQDITGFTGHTSEEVLLLKSGRSYQKVIDNFSDALVIDDCDGKIIFANKRFLRMFGLSDEDMFHFILEDYVAPEYREALRDRHNRRVAGEEVPTKYIFEGIHKDSTRLWLEAKVAKVTRKGRIIGTQSAIRDITGERENLERLRNSELEKTKLLDELTKKYNELMQFNYIVSHNLRSPIANMIGLCEIIGLAEVSQDEKMTILEDVKRVISKMDELVKDLNVILSLSSPLNEKKATCYVRAMLYGITHTLERQIKESGTVINTDIDDDANKIVTIKSYLESILYNLISNAIKYKSPARPPRIDVKVKKTSQEWIISVSDNGMGINLEKNGKYLFGLYKRFNFEVGGKGLGLHMTKVQVEALGGEIFVESAVNKGSTFTFTLPVSHGV